MVSTTRVWPALVFLLAGASLAGCESTLNTKNFVSSLPEPDAAYDVVVEEYRIAPTDKVTVMVYPDPGKDFSLSGARVDEDGNLFLPQVGMIPVKGLTPKEAGGAVSARLGECCLQRPQVVVQIDSTTSLQVIVTGAVTAEGVYNVRAGTTLLEAISLAKGPDRATANLRRVAVFRTVDGKRMGALFDVVAIRDGRAEDPVVFGGDEIIVDSSQAKSAWRAAVQAVPFFGVFSAL